MGSNSVNMQAHPSIPAVDIKSFRVGWALEGACLSLQYSLMLPSGGLRIPEPGPARRTDGLWRHSCFEVFFSEEEGSGYQEYNFSPSGAWAHYRFSDYRQLASNDAVVTVPEIQQIRNGECLNLSVSIEVPELITAYSLAAVMEDKRGHLSYWANTHPAEEPDFHHPDARCLNLA